MYYESKEDSFGTQDVEYFFRSKLSDHNTKCGGGGYYKIFKIEK